jgi:tetratricopeptide (TPR) repeat protein
MASANNSAAGKPDANLTDAAEVPSGPWIYNPWLDLLAGCGAWSAPLLLLAAYVAKSNVHAWIFAFYFLALLFNYPHFMATVYRAYHSYSEFAKYRVFTVHIALLLALTGVIAHLWYPLVSWIFTLYICWSPWHYTGQNFGLLMMFGRRFQLDVTPAERRALHLSFIASFVMLMLSFHTGPSNDALILSLGLSAKFTSPARAVLALFFVVASGWTMVSLARRNGLRAIAAPLTLAVTQFLWFLLPALIELISGQEVAQTRYSSGILAVLHSAQYLWITSYYQRREARAAGMMNWRLSGYLLTLVAGGIALFIPGPWLVSRIFHVDFAASFLTFTALVNIHHFFLDGALWKLRDSRIAKLLLDTRGGTAGVEPNQTTGFARAAGWIAGPNPVARTLRAATAALLIAWAGVDLMHFYWSSAANNAASLQRAARLNPDDSAVQLRLARAEKLAGHREAALQALQRAALVNPGNLSLQESYARGLIEAGRDAEAFALYQNILARVPRNTDALVNYGLLAHHLGHDEEAADSWQRAVDVDPSQANAQLYLAQALDQRGEVQAAARHYRAYLQAVAARPAEHSGERTTVLVALVKVADADVTANRNADALQGYTFAVHSAEKSGEKTLESLALSHLAELQEKTGNAAAAERSYQRALTLDLDLSDPRSAASDWLNYGQFLRRQQQPERLVFACFLRAEDLVRATPGEELSAITQARAKSEARLGHEAAQVRRTLESSVREALSLQPETSPARR